MTDASFRLSATVIAITVGSASAQVLDSKAEARRVLATQVEAWNRGDVAAFCAVYAEDAVFLSPSGVTQGRQAVLDRYRKKYPDRAAMGELTLEPIEVRTFPIESGRRAEAVTIAG